MPNHVETMMTVTGPDKDVKRFVDTHITEEYDKWEEKNVDYFDFNTIIPKHPDLDKAISPSRTEKHLKDAKERGASEKEIKEIMEQIELVKSNVERFGYGNWYDFCIAKWGTKWGAYSCKVEQDDKGMFRMRYQTAWSPATPVFNKLAEMYPTLTFKVNVLDEGGSFGGTQVWSNGEYSEDALQGQGAMATFSNEVFGTKNRQCDQCSSWYDPEYHEKDYDKNLCYECNYENEENETEEVD